MTTTTSPGTGGTASTDELAVGRGTTVVTPRAVVAIARQAASEVDGVELVSGSGLRRLLSGFRPGGGSDGASAEVTTGSASLELHLAVCWPRPVAQVTEEARRHVRSRVSELTGYAVNELDIVVDALPPPARRRRRVE